MMKIKVYKDTSRLEKLDKVVPMRAETTTDHIADRVVDNIHQNWSAVSPSAPGERPAVVTGTLDLSVTKEKTGRGAGGRFAAGKDTFLRVITVGAPYADKLEHGTVSMMPRPFVLPAVMDEVDNIGDEFKELFSFKW